MTIQERSQPGAEETLGNETQRERWIRQHNTFLTAAVTGKIRVPRIPRRRIDEGGFTDYVNRPGVRALMSNWWNRILDATTLDP